MVTLPKRFSILTDESPRFKSYSKVSLKETLDACKVSYIEVEGSYEGTKEKSYLTSLTEIQAQELGKFFGQESILYVELDPQNNTSRNKLVFCQGDQDPIEDFGFDLWNEEPSVDCYTKLPNGQFITFNL